MSTSAGRQHDRVPISLEVHYRTKGSFLVSYSLNLSRGGLFLETADLLPVGTQLTIRFSVPGSDAPIETQAEVMWVRRKTSEEGLPPGLGLQFDDVESRIGHAIDSLVQGFAGVQLQALADDPMVLKRMDRYLQSILSCKVLRASAARVIATGFEPHTDLALVDLDTTGEPGLTLIQMAQNEVSPAIPIIAISKDPLLKAAALREGAATALDNPPDFEKLRREVLTVLGAPERQG